MQAADGRPAVEDLSFGPGPGLSPAPRPGDATGLGVEEERREVVGSGGAEVVRSGGGEGVRSAGGGVRSGEVEGVCDEGGEVVRSGGGEGVRSVGGEEVRSDGGEGVRGEEVEGEREEGGEVVMEEGARRARQPRGDLGGGHSDRATRSSSQRRCCRCNGVAKCLRCSCVRKGSPCSCCLPGEAGKCHNANSRPPCDLSSAVLPSSGSKDSLTSSEHSQVSPLVVQTGPSSPLSICPDLPSLTTIFQASCPTLQHVPKGARDCWARAFSECLAAVCDVPADLSSWSKLFMIAKCVLASPATGHRLRWREITTLVRSRIDRWRAGDVASLWSKAVAGGHSLSKRAQSSSGSQRSRNIRRAKLSVQDGQYSKAIKALTSNGLATPSAEVLEEMLEKHPQVPPPTLLSGPAPPPLILSESVVKRGVRSFPNGSAPGPSGLRPSHLREAVCCPSPDRAALVLSPLTKFLNLLAAGQAPTAITPHLCGASLLASRKRKGGHRPIAVGEVLRRLVSKCLASLVRSAATSLLTPLQLGVNVRGGCEAIVHGTSQLMALLPESQCWTLL